MSGFGVGTDVLWDALVEGRSALAPIRRFDASGFSTDLAAEVPDDFSIRDWVPKTYRKATKVMARDVELAVAAASWAVDDAQLVTKAKAGDEGETTYKPVRVGCQIGAGLIAADVDELTRAFATARREGTDELDDAAWGEAGMFNLTPLWMLKYLPNMLACHVTIIHDAQGPSNTLTNAQASGLLSVGESRAVIERGDADACLSGSAESKVNPMGLQRIALADRLARTEAGEDPLSVQRPYAEDARGGLLGEGGGILILEALDEAQRRGAPIKAEVIGFGAGHEPRSDDPVERSAGLRNAVAQALRDAGIGPEAVDAIVPEAPCTLEKDLEERSALEAVFGDRLAEVPLVTLAGGIGHAMAGEGGLAACVACRCLVTQRLPARLHPSSPRVGLQGGAQASEERRLRHVLVCSGSIGGQSAALVLRRWDGS